MLHTPEYSSNLIFSFQNYQTKGTHYLVLLDNWQKRILSEEWIYGYSLFLYYFHLIDINSHKNSNGGQMRNLEV